MINIINGNKVYNDNTNIQCHALKNINLTIEKGEMVAIKGRSGSGKSTLLNIIGCTDTLTSGEYLYKDTDIKKQNNSSLSKIRNRNFGFIMQDYGLIPGNTSLENVSLPLYFSTVRLKDIKELSKAVLCRVNMIEFANKKISFLSGGQKQRISIARALVNNPEVILADEPTGALDSNATEDIMNIFKELNKTGITIIIVSHDDYIASLCTRKVFLEDGRIINESNHDQQQKIKQTQ